MERRWRQDGFNLLELMLALLVVAALLFTTIRYFVSAEKESRVTQAIKQIDTLVQASYDWVQGEPSFYKLSIDKLVDSGYLPNGFKTGTKNPWLGNITISADANNPHRLRISLTSVPHKACINLMEKLRSQVAIRDNNPNITSCPDGDPNFWGVF